MAFTSRRKKSRELTQFRKDRAARADPREMDLSMLRIVAFLAVCVSAYPVSALQSCRVASGTQLLPLVELYTSEGCDSCPPADRWLRRQFPPTDAHPSAVAIAFHVDYWDRLGWKDRFASAAYTERQYASMRANAATFVYTPQVLLQGHDWQAWAAGSAPVERAAKIPARATISVETTVSGDSVVVVADATVADAALRSDAQLFVAYADSGLHSDVAAGENRGKRLVHDHVVRALQSPGNASAEGRLHGRFEFRKPAEAGTAPTLIAFVQRRTTGDILQTVAAPLAGCGT